MNIEEKNIPDAIRRAGRHVVAFHACSSDRGTPGEDHLPWSEIVAALLETGYAGPVVIEAFTPSIKEIARAVSLWRPLAESEDAPRPKRVGPPADRLRRRTALMTVTDHGPSSRAKRCISFGETPYLPPQRCG